MKIFALFIVLLTSAKSFAMPVDVHGYLRSGVGNNLSGGKQNCFNNPGAEGNEFRLGNECGIYGETTFSLEFLEKNAANSSFKAQTTLAFFPAANTQYGDESSTNDVDIVEAFVESKNIDGIPYTYWVGKRFYRDVDVHMNDFYYFAAMNGVGAGIKDVPLFNGKFALAYLQETMTNSANSQTLSKSYLDARLFDLNSSLGSFNLWAVIARSPKGTLNTTRYEAVDGQAFGVRLRNSLANGFNDFAIIYGRNLMYALSVYGNGEIQNGVDNDKRNKIRVVEHLTNKFSDSIEYHAVATLEHRNNGGTSSTWWDVGLRPVYFIKDHLHFVTEIGHSQVVNRNNTLTLSRLTLAYEIALNKSIWARPVIRAFATETIWNKDNRVNFNGRSEGHSVGVQAEAWF